MTDDARTVVVKDTGGQTLGYVAIDSTVRGKGRGGLRMLPDVTQDEMEKLARAMTLKYGLLGLPQGGAKAGVLGDPEASAEDKAARLHQFASAARGLLESRRYLPDADMGTTGTEIQRMLEGVGLRVARREHRGTSSGEYTAGTVFEGARAAAAALGLPLDGIRVAIEGFGKVGGPLSQMFVRAGARVVAISTMAGGLYDPSGLNIDRLQESARRAGSAAVEEYKSGERIELADVKLVDAEIFCPCARHDSVKLADAPRMTARVISCGANCPVTPEGDDALWARGVVCVPDFVANCGGVLGGTMEFAGWQPEEIFGFYADRFRARVEDLIGMALKSGKMLRTLAQELALARFAEVKLAAENGSWESHLLDAGVELYRDGWLPRRLMRRMSAGYFRNRL